MLGDVVAGAFIGGMIGAFCGWMLVNMAQFMMKLDECTACVDIDDLDLGNTIAPKADIHPAVIRRQKMNECLDNLYKGKTDGDGIWES